MNFTFSEYLQIAYFILTIIIICASINVARSWVRIKKETNDLNNFKLNVDCPNNLDAVKLLDQIIADSISDYVLLNRSSLNNAEYINSEEETKMLHDIADIVSNGLSDIMISKLRVYYTQDAISTIIANKTYIQVTAYIVSVNSVKSDKKE